MDVDQDVHVPNSACRKALTAKTGAGVSGGSTHALESAVVVSYMRRSTAGTWVCEYHERCRPSSRPRSNVSGSPSSHKPSTSISECLSCVRIHGRSSFVHMSFVYILPKRGWRWGRWLWRKLQADVASPNPPQLRSTEPTGPQPDTHRAILVYPGHGEPFICALAGMRGQKAEGSQQ